jgi:hypothetical protein
MMVPVGQKERDDCERMHAVIAQVGGRIGHNATELSSVMDTARDR